MSRENSGSATKSSSSSGMSMSISSASHTKMDTSCASIPESLNLNNSSISMSMSIDSRDTMTHLARKIEPVIHENIEFAPLDMSPGEELNLRSVPHMHTIPMFRLVFKFLTFLCVFCCIHSLSSSFSMSTDERLIKYTSGSTTTTPSVQKTFDFNPESVSMSMGSWSQVRYSFY